MENENPLFGKKMKIAREWAGLSIENLSTDLEEYIRIHRKRFSHPKVKDLPVSVTSLKRHEAGSIQKRNEKAFAELYALFFNYKRISPNEFLNSSISEKDFRDILDGKRNSIFDGYINDKAEGFIGRQFVFDKFDHFIRENASGYFMIKGDPGIGKSAIAAKLVKERGYVHHFNIALLGITRPAQFLENICAQLIERYELLHPDLPPNAYQSGLFFNQLLDEVGKKVTGDAPLVIIIDALDEVDLKLHGERENLLFLPGHALPDNVYMLLTSRFKHEHSDRFQAANLKTFELHPSLKENKTDARIMIEAQCNDDRMQQKIDQLGIGREEFVSTLLDKSESNFMYLHHVLPAIKAGRFVLGSIDDIPQGLDNYYRSHWRQMKTVDLPFEPVICLLAVVKQAVSAAYIAEVTRIDLDVVTQIIRDWREFLHEEPGEDRKCFYRIYHNHFQEFLSREVAPGLVKYHKMITRHYYAKLTGKPTDGP